MSTKFVDVVRDGVVWLGVRVKGVVQLLHPQSRVGERRRPGQKRWEVLDPIPCRRQIGGNSVYAQLIAILTPITVDNATVARALALVPNLEHDVDLLVAEFRDGFPEEFLPFMDDEFVLDSDLEGFGASVIGTHHGNALHLWFPRRDTGEKTSIVVYPASIGDYTKI